MKAKPFAHDLEKHIYFCNQESVLAVFPVAKNFKTNNVDDVTKMETIHKTGK